MSWSGKKNNPRKKCGNRAVLCISRPRGFALTERASNRQAAAGARTYGNVIITLQAITPPGIPTGMVNRLLERKPSVRRLDDPRGAQSVTVAGWAMRGLQGRKTNPSATSSSAGTHINPEQST